MTEAERPLVLASTSKFRRALMDRVGLPFECRAPDYDERAEDHQFEAMGPEAFAMHLARGKAHSLRDAYSRAYILAGDQLAVIEGDDGRLVQMHKPPTAEAAIAQLMRLRGRTHRLITGVVLLALDERQPPREFTTLAEQRMTMRRFSEAEAAAYVAAYEPLDSNGAYHIEDAGIRLFERIEGPDFTAIMGLPLLSVCALLRQVGLLPQDDPHDDARAEHP